jgi:hypothetical protein
MDRIGFAGRIAKKFILPFILPAKPILSILLNHRFPASV